MVFFFFFLQSVIELVSLISLENFANFWIPVFFSFDNKIRVFRDFCFCFSSVSNSTNFAYFLKNFAKFWFPVLFSFDNKKGFRNFIGFL